MMAALVGTRFVRPGAMPATFVTGAKRPELHNAMSLETRKRGTTHFYKARKIRGRVVKKYEAAGAAAELAERIERELRVAQHEESERKRAALAAFDQEDDAIDDLFRRTETLVRATLLGTGYHQRDRGEWRRRRGQ